MDSLERWFYGGVTSVVFLIVVAFMAGWLS